MQRKKIVQKPKQVQVKDESPLKDSCSSKPAMSKLLKSESVSKKFTEDDDPPLSEENEL